MNEIPSSTRIMSAMNEQQIITLAQSGEQQAYRQLVERYQTGLIIYCENILKNRQDGEDVAQDTFVTAYYSLAKYHPAKAAFSTWLYRIAANKAKDRLRRRKQHIDIDLIEDIVGHAESLSNAEKQEVRDKVMSLQPPEYATVIQAYFWDGKRYEAIAEELAVPIGTVSTWITRAKAKLRKELL